MSKFRKPLNIFGVLENTIITTQHMEKTKQVVTYINELSKKYNLDDVVDYAEVSKMFSKEDLKKAEIIRDFDRERNALRSQFNTQYKNSLRKTF